MIEATHETPLEARLLRVYCVSGDRAGDKALHEAIVESARGMGLRGASVLSSKMGYSRDGTYFDEVLSDVFIDRQPLIVEIVDLPAPLRAFLPLLHRLVRGRRLITIERAGIIYYEPHSAASHSAT